MTVRFTNLPPMARAAPARAASAGPIEVAREIRPGDRLAAPESASTFGAFLDAQVQQVNAVQHEADAAVASVASGQSGNLHEMMIALSKADLSFRMLTRVRNKVIDAYQEIMRMQI